jgi:hypothetical protein
MKTNRFVVITLGSYFMNESFIGSFLGFFLCREAKQTSLAKAQEKALAPKQTIERVVP